MELGNVKEFTLTVIFVKAKGPLFSVGFANISSLVSSFRVNSDILLLTVKQVVNFPFVKKQDNAKK